MSLKVTVQPTGFPVGIKECKRALGLVPNLTTHDDRLEWLRQAATKRVEKDIQKALITQTIVEYSERFPFGQGPIELNRPPVQSVSSIAYRDTSGDTQTYDAAKYRLHSPDDGLSVIQPIIDQEWPDTDRLVAAVEVTYLAGFGENATFMPKELVTAILMLVVHWFENPGLVSVAPNLYPVPKTYDFAISGHLWSFVT